MCISVGCTQMGGDDDLLGEGEGKADNVTEVPTNEPLEFEVLQNIACEAVAMNSVFDSEDARAALLDGCNDFLFIITKKTQSSLYQHTSSRLPVSLAMDISINDGAADRAARLYRVYSREQERFVWRGTVPDPIADEPFIAELSRAAGADMNLDDSIWRFHLRTVEWDDMPAGLFRNVEDKLAEINSLDLAPDFEVANLADNPREIRRDDADGQRHTIGYLVPMDLAMETGDPVSLWLYYANDGRLIDAVPDGVID
jgi:hypothetical protein